MLAASSSSFIRAWLYCMRRRHELGMQRCVELDTIQLACRSCIKLNLSVHSLLMAPCVHSIFKLGYKTTVAEQAIRKAKTLWQQGFRGKDFHLVLRTDQPIELAGTNP